MKITWAELLEHLLEREREKKKKKKKTRKTPCNIPFHPTKKEVSDTESSSACRNGATAGPQSSYQLDNYP